MRDKELTMNITLTVSGGEGWAERFVTALDGVNVLLHETTLMSAKGDGNEYSFEYKIALSDGKQYDCPACGSHLIFESDVADLKNTFGLTEPDFDLMLSREKR
jgi:hypothetical protein